MFWRKKKPIVEEVKPIPPAPPPPPPPLPPIKMLQVVEDVRIFCQEFTVKFEDGTTITKVLYEHVCETIDSYENPNKRDRKDPDFLYLPRRQKRVLASMRWHLMDSVSRGEFYTLDSGTDQPFHFNTKGAKELSFGELEQIDTATIVTWIRETEEL